MKLNVGQYEIEVKAKNTVLSTRANKRDAMHFLNYVSRAFYLAGERLAELDYDALATEADVFSNDIYTALKMEGLYD